MNIVIDTDKIMEEVNIEEHIKERIVNSCDVCEIIESTISSEKTQELIENKTNEIIINYLNSDEWKEFIINNLKSSIEDLDLSEEDDVKKMFTGFLVNKLKDLN